MLGTSDVGRNKHAWLSLHTKTVYALQAGGVHNSCNIVVLCLFLLQHHDNVD